jgi:hypothetical protein
MSIVVYYHTIVADLGGPVSVPRASYFAMDQMTGALAFCKEMRDAGNTHVSMSIENPNSVGKPGVDSIVDGKTPDGHDYTWMKRRTQ